ncbi:MAG: PDZ domain-containing protein [Acidobacteriota bacterium]|nr:PDZ domain-containing protein [Acidobacteriota bacterium]
MITKSEKQRCFASWSVPALLAAFLFTAVFLAPASLRAQQAAPPAPPPPPRARTFRYIANFGSGAFLGVILKDVTAEEVRTMKLPGEYGAIVTHVEADSPAAKAGLKENDVILEFGGMRVWSADQLAQLVHETPPGRTVTLGISRAGRKLNLTASLANRSASAAMPAFAMPQIHINPRTFDFHYAPFGPHLGIHGETLTSQLAAYFGVKQGSGVLVEDVEKDSPAAKAGLEAGDCIVKVGSTAIASVFELQNALAEAKGSQATLTIVRAKQEQTLTATLDPAWRPQDAIQGHVFGPGIKIQPPVLRRDLLPRTEEIEKQLEKQAPLMRRQAEQIERRAQRLERRIQLLQQRTGSGEV